MINFCKGRANGLRYLRWGGDGEAVQLEKWKGVENCLRFAQNPQRQVHALLEGFAQDSLIENQKHRHKTEKIIARTLIFSKNVSTGSTTAKNYKPKSLQENLTKEPKQNLPKLLPKKSCLDKFDNRADFENLT